MNAATAEGRALRDVIWWNVLTGIWLIVAPFALDYAPAGAGKWNSIAVGILVMITGLARGTGRSSKQTGCNWLNVVSGIWLIISPFVLGFSHQAAPLWNSVILGLVLGLSVLVFRSRTSTR